MRVLRVSAGLDPAHGGPPVSTVTSCLAALAVGVETVVAAVYEPEGAELVARLEAGGAEVVSFPLARHAPGLAWRWSVSPALSAWVRRHAGGFDVLHAHGAWTYTTLTTLLAGLRAGRPVVLSPHESLTDFDLGTSGPADALLKKAVRSWYRRSFAALVFASELEREASHGSKRRAAVIPHALELPSAPAASTSNGTLRVGFLGRFDPKKNLDVVLEALPSGAVLHIAGDGTPEARAAAVDWARAAGVEDRTTWHGFVRGHDKESFFAGIDVLAMPSEFEGFGLAAAEALAAGVPVVVSRNTGIAPIVERHGCGAVVAPTVAELGRALADPALPSKGAAARRAAEAELALEAHGARLRKLYEEVV